MKVNVHGITDYEQDIHSNNQFVIGTGYMIAVFDFIYSSVGFSKRPWV